MQIEFDTGPLGRGSLFRAPTRIFRADTPEQVAPVLAEMAQARRDGLWLAGAFSYELGYCFSHRLLALMPARRKVPLILFGGFEACEPALPPAPPRALQLDLTPVWDAARYAQAFARLHDYIAAGDVYQVNLTFPLSGRTTASPADLYGALRAAQPVGHGCLMDLGGPVLLSRSPELFFRCDAGGQMTVRPMKGTVQRGATPKADAAARDWLQTSEKNRAENLMIVDLLRNDLSRISQLGSVKVPHLFKIETYTTLHQMTSTVTSRLRPGVDLPEIIEALFPCGSITGAPKIRAMQIINELEGTARDAYCGAIGWVAPDGAMCFNVAIRTLMLEPGGQVTLNVGGGVVADSKAGDEYQEALWKSAFAQRLLQG